MSKDSKLGRLDLKVTINDESIINIEMQMKDNYNTEQRTAYYGSRLVSEQLAKKDKYETIKPVILINILDYNFTKLPEYHTETVTVAKRHRDYELVKDIKYHFIELPKFRKSEPELANSLECWLAFIDSYDRGLIQMAGEKEKIIQEAEEELEEILSSQALKEIIEYKESAMKERATIQAYEREHGRKEGRIEAKIEIAKEMLKHDMEIEMIMQYTKLSKEEIKKIKIDK